MASWCNQRQTVLTRIAAPMSASLIRRAISPKYVEAQRLRILAGGEPQKIVLFGARALGEARADSAYDRVPVEPSDRPRHQRAARYRRALTGWAGAKDILN